MSPHNIMMPQVVNFLVVLCNSDVAESVIDA